MVLGGRRNSLINKGCQSANKTTNQGVGGSNPSGRAIKDCKNKRLSCYAVAAFCFSTTSAGLLPDCSSHTLFTVWVANCCSSCNRELRESSEVSLLAELVSMRLQNTTPLTYIRQWRIILI